MHQQTTAGRATTQKARTEGEGFARSDTYEWLARAGLAARGVTYGIVAVLALKLALGDGGKATNQQGAMKTLAAQPFGKVLLVLVAVGLFGYAAWRLTRAAIGHGKEIDDEKMDRVGGVVSGIAYAGLFVTAVQVIAGSGGSSGHPDKATGGVLGWPGGPWIIGIVGLIVIGVGLEQGRRGITQEFLEDSKTGEMSARMRKAFTIVGVLGHLARMAVFALIGVFLIKAAIEFDPQKAVGLDGALAEIRQASYGPILLGIVAAGLLGFATYSALDARYAKV